MSGDATCRSQNQRPLNNENDYDLVLGGQLRIPHVFNGTNKLFGFFSFEQYRKGQGTNVQIRGIQPYQTGQPLNNSCAGGVTGDDGCFRFNFAGDQRALINHVSHFNPFNGLDRSLVGTVNTVGSNQVVDFSTIPFSDPNANVSTTGRFASATVRAF